MATKRSIDLGLAFGGYGQTMPTALLFAIASRSADAVAAARMELAGRGIGRDGTWVGFTDAEAEWSVGPILQARRERMIAQLRHHEIAFVDAGPRALALVLEGDDEDLARRADLAAICADLVGCSVRTARTHRGRIRWITVHV